MLLLDAAAFSGPAPPQAPENRGLGPARRRQLAEQLAPRSPLRCTFRRVSGSDRSAKPDPFGVLTQNRVCVSRHVGRSEPLMRHCLVPTESSRLSRVTPELLAICHCDAFLFVLPCSRQQRPGSMQRFFSLGVSDLVALMAADRETCRPDHRTATCGFILCSESSGQFEPSPLSPLSKPRSLSGLDGVSSSWICGFD